MAALNVESSKNSEEDQDSDSEPESLRCYECDVTFVSSYYLKNHLLFHVRQPSIRLEKIPQPPPIKLTFKSTSENNFEVVFSPSTASSLYSPKSLTGDPVSTTDPTENDGQNLAEFEETADESHQDSGVGSIEGVSPIDGVGSLDDVNSVSFSPNFAGDVGDIGEHLGQNGEGDAAPGDESCTDQTGDSSQEIEHPSEEGSSGPSEFNNIPGAEPTPPPEPSPEYPKIRIKTSGLLKESLTITEITDDNPNGGYDRPDPSAEYQTSEPISLSEIVELDNNHLENTIWATPSLEDPLKLPDSDKDENSIITNLFSNNDRAKDLGFTSSENEFISLDRLDDRNRGALQVYNSNAASSSYNSNPLDSLAGLPMQQLAQQVSRLQPGSGMHQQNVLINIQQFPQAPPQPPHTYQPPPMYPHPPHPGHPQQPPMYQPYQYQPPNPMYYPPAPHAPGYPPHMPPPRPQMPQHPQQQMGQPMPSMQQPPQYRQPQMTPPRQPSAPRQQPVQQGQRPPMGPRQQMAPRQPMQPRQRAPMMRPRGQTPMQMRAPRPRMTGPPQGQPQGNSNGQQQGPRMIKRTPEQIQAIQAKRKRMDVLVPDKHDDADCQVIAVQPKNTGLPQIQSVQGGAPEQTHNSSSNSCSNSDNSIMHLSDSITLSVRNPPPRVQSPKKSDAKAVANILATRGITVTAAPKPKDKEPSSPRKTSPPPPPVAINLNSAVSIIPSANKQNSKPSTPEPRLPTVDLTDDSVSDSQPKPSQQKPNQRALPFRCDLCPAQYPNSLGLNKHRQSFHKTGGPCEFGVPLIDLKQPGILQRLSNIGIHNYIPISGANTDNTLALPVINVNALAKNSNLGALGASTVLTLGPIRSLPRQQVNSNGGNK